MRVLNAMAQADATKPGRVYEEYDIKNVKVDDGWNVYVILKLKKGLSRWPCVRFLVNAGSRLETEIGASEQIHIRSITSEEMYLRMKFAVKAEGRPTEDKIVDAIHSLYLWMEHPEKYT